MDDDARLEGRTVYDGRILRVAVDRVRLPNGGETELEVIRHRGAAAAVPVDDDGRVLLVRQYRYAAGGYLLEIPAGKLDGDEEPAACALRETEEETGFRPGRLEPLGWIWTTPGFTDEKIWLYLARDLRPATQRLESHEVLSVEPTGFDDAVRAAIDGRIVDGKSVCGLLRAAALLGDGTMPGHGSTQS